MNAIKKSTIAMHMLLGTPVITIGPRGSGMIKTILDALSEANIHYCDVSFPNPYDYNGYYDTDALNKFTSTIRQLDINYNKDVAFIFENFQKVSTPVGLTLLELMNFSGRKILCIGTFIPHGLETITDRCAKVYF